MTSALIFNLVVLLVAIFVLIFMSYKGFNIYISSVAAALVIIVFTPSIGFFSGLKLMETGTANFAQGYLVYFFLAVVLGDVMNASGTATTIGNGIVKASGGRFVVPTILIVCGVITTCGISGYVSAFTIFPIILPVVKAVKFPRELLPGVMNAGLLLGCGILPYNTLTNNTIPPEFLGSSIAGVPLLRLGGFAFALIGCTLYFSYQTKKIRARMTDGEILAEYDMYNDEVQVTDFPPMITSAPPILIGLAFLIVMTNLGYWGTMPNVYTTLAISIVLTIAMNYKRMKGKIVSTVQGALTKSVGSMMTCAIVIGFGKVVQASPFFTEVVEWLDKTSMNPYFQASLVVSALSCMTASSPGGIRMAMEVFSQRWIASGANVNALGAISTCAGLGLNTMPHNGTVICVSQRTRLPVKGTFRHTFACAALLIFLTSLFEAAIASFVWPV